QTIAVLDGEGATGWRGLPVEILGKKDEPIQGYALLVVTGRAGPVDDSRSARAVIPPPPGGKAVSGWIGLYFDEDSWDGSDIFCLDKTGYVVLTERIKTAFERAKLSNFQFTPLTEVKRLML